jgi:hypothetical protein
MIRCPERLGNLMRDAGWAIKQCGADNDRDVEHPRKLD